MKFFQLTSAILLIGILSDAITATPQVEDQRAKKQGSQNIASSVGRQLTTPADLGIAQIAHVRYGYMCTGVHLKPWIVLTTASCVRGENMTLVYVEIYNSRIHKQLKGVSIQDVYIHPKYDWRTKKNNFAMLSIYAKFYWDVKPFSLPDNDYTGPEIVWRSWRTQVMRWQWHDSEKDYRPYSCRTEVITDGLCGDSSAVVKNICVRKGECKKTFTTHDNGAPLYLSYRSSWVLQHARRILLGLYTGNDLKNSDNKLFERVYPVLGFIYDFIHKHRLPPSV